MGSEIVVVACAVGPHVAGRVALAVSSRLQVVRAARAVGKAISWIAFALGSEVTLDTGTATLWPGVVGLAGSTTLRPTVIANAGSTALGSWVIPATGSTALRSCVVANTGSTALRAGIARWTLVKGAALRGRAGDAGAGGAEERGQGGAVTIYVFWFGAVTAAGEDIG